MMKWTGLAPWEFEFPFPGSLTSTFLVQMGRGDTADVDSVSDLPGIDLPGPIVACNADY